MLFVNSRIFFKIIWFLYDNDPRHERVKCNRYTDNSNDFYFFYLDVNRLMITNNYIVKFQNRVVNHESRPVKSENS